MRRLFSIAAVVATSMATLPLAAQFSVSPSAGTDTFREIIAAQVKQFEHAQAITAPCPCEASTSYFTRIGERHGQATNEDLYGELLILQVNRFRLENETIAPIAPSEPEAAIRELPGSMARNQAEDTNRDWYSRKITEQTKLNTRIKRADSART